MPLKGTVSRSRERANESDTVFHSFFEKEAKGDIACIVYYSFLDMKGIVHI